MQTERCEQEDEGRGGEENGHVSVENLKRSFSLGLSHLVTVTKPVSLFNGLCFKTSSCRALGNALCHGATQEEQEDRQQKRGCCREAPPAWLVETGLHAHFC